MSESRRVFLPCPSMMDDFDTVEPAPEWGTSIYWDVVEVAFTSCMDRCEFDISCLEKEEQDRIFMAVLDAWMDWPEPNDGAWQAAADCLRSMAVAGGWDELPDGRCFEGEA